VSETRIRVEGRAGRITLTRPKALNALSRAMIAAIDWALAAWADDPAVALVLLDAEGGRAFCAGGDIAAIWHAAQAGEHAAAQAFWAEEYRMNARLAAYPKPVVAFLDGIVMGGGVGLGGHVSHRIVGETTRIAMPECMIGLVPDVGSTHLLARAPGRLGEYLGLTGHRMDPGEALAAGFADRFVPLARWEATKAALIATGDAAAAYADAALPPATAGGSAHRRAAIDAAFAAPDVPAILAALPGDEWGTATRATLERSSALSMAATLRLVRAARAEPGVAAALVREYRFTRRAHTEGELLEGIRAAVIDKDRSPRWRHGIDDLPEGAVAAMLAPLGAAELALPQGD
jgi:3-hydroxyisobutyrate dehydrogenase/enoyl-CoA hydratase